MPRYSDAALLKGEFTHMAAELRAGNRTAPSADEWQKTSCENNAEEAAQAVAKQIFDLQSKLDQEKEQLEIISICAAGAMVVMGIFPGDGDLLRLEGLLLADKQPVAQLIHASQLALTITKKLTADAAPEEDASQIGFVIFDQLEKRAAQKVAPTKKTSKTSTTAKAKTNKRKN